jgi:hypothetical protein
MGLVNIDILGRNRLPALKRVFFSYKEHMQWIGLNEDPFDDVSSFLECPNGNKIAEYGSPLGGAPEIGLDGRFHLSTGGKKANATILWTGCRFLYNQAGGAEIKSIPARQRSGRDAGLEPERRR